MWDWLPTTSAALGFAHFGHPLGFAPRPGPSYRPATTTYTIRRFGPPPTSDSNRLFKIASILMFP